MAEIKLLCLERSLRKQKLAPFMINELTRRVHLKDIWQAVYISDYKCPTPITTSQYWNFPLNREKAIEFKAIEAQSLSRYSRSYKLPNAVVTLGFRKMESSDIPSVTKLLRTYLKQFKVALDFDKNDIKHWFLPQDSVVYSYVVVNLECHIITDFFSFYTNHLQ
ncbi:Glycylpeptide N-tetradecanoyltransferase 1 [Cardamine amara subsp. amara]|uniref:Glycylpeptide N-tetradecanoyltransferase n=1 Tax=Cardamine amara subsp. amara TaxID=228776 RepID=A0ABD1BYE3_CARAN